jgi:hypothetical protein
MTLPLEDILIKIYEVIEHILPFLVPFIHFILPIIVIIGGFLRTFIGENLFPYFPLYPETEDYTIWIIAGSSVLLFSLLFLFIMPERRNGKKEN